MTEIVELTEAARRVLKAWRLPNPDADGPRTYREWQQLLDEHTRGQAKYQSGDALIGRLVDDLSHHQ